jgi:hypothetical protein
MDIEIVMQELDTLGKEVGPFEVRQDKKKVSCLLPKIFKRI